jgi:hypothetical protein
MAHHSRRAHSSRRSRVDCVRTLKYQPYGGRLTGLCEIDLLAKEYVKKNIFSVCWDESLVRDAVELAFLSALEMSKDMLIRWPDERRKVERLLDDLLLIRTLLDRNKELFIDGVPGRQMVENYLTLKDNLDLPSFHQWRNRLQKLIPNLKKMNTDISFILDTSEVSWESIEFAGPRGNFDPLTFFFIEYQFYEVWCVLRPLQNNGLQAPRMPRQDIRPFACFLAAIWTDLKLPLQDHRGRLHEPLQEWFADRIRKHFKDHWGRR